MVTGKYIPHYDPRVHITAGSLRRLGFYLSEMIPDQAFVRRIAVGLDATEQFNDGSATLGLSVVEPFHVGEPRTYRELVAA
jgi:hypothetical protein